VPATCAGDVGDERPTVFLTVGRFVLMKNKFNRFFRKYLDDLLVLAGCGCILYATSLWSRMAFWYLAGLFLIGFGFMIARRK
jgi:hypothetical protein